MLKPKLCFWKSVPSFILDFACHLLEIVWKQHRNTYVSLYLSIFLCVCVCVCVCVETRLQTNSEHISDGFLHKTLPWRMYLTDTSINTCSIIVESLCLRQHIGRLIRHWKHGRESLAGHGIILLSCYMSTHRFRRGCRLIIEWPRSLAPPKQRLSNQARFGNESLFVTLLGED